MTTTIDPNVEWLKDDSGNIIGYIGERGVANPFAAADYNTDLASKTDQLLGGNLVGFADAMSQGKSAPYLRTVSDMLSGLPVSADRFIDKTKISGIRDYSSTYNSQPDLQDAIYACMYESKSGLLSINSGLYNIEDVLSVGYGNTFKQLTIAGAGSSYKGEIGFGGTILSAKFSDRPAIAIQGGRRIRVSRLSIVGLNLNYLNSIGAGGLTPTVDDIDIDTWIAPTLHANAASRYAPYCAIAIDPYSGVRPSVAYPDVIYPTRSGISGQYGKSYSSGVALDDVAIHGFVAGICVQPSDADGNGDFVTLNNSTISHCAYGVSIGNSQSRQVNITGGLISNVHTALTNRAHGKQIGKFGGVISGVSIEGAIRLFDLSRGYCGPINFNGCYGELVYRLGDSDSPSLPSTLTMTGCEWSMSYVPRRGVPANISTGAEIILNGGTLRAQSVATISASHTNKLIMNCGDMNGSPSAARVLAQHSSAGLLPIGVAIVKDASSSIDYQASGRKSANSLHNPSGRGVPISRLAQNILHTESANSGLSIPSPRLISVAGKAQGILSLTGISGTLDLTLASGSLPYGIRAGDVIQDDATGTVLIVDSNVGLLASVTAANNYYDPGSGVVIRDVISPTEGSWYIIPSRLYGTTYPLFGTITSGSATITATGRDDGYSAFTATDIAVGDFLYQNSWILRCFPVGVTVVSIDAIAKTITMSVSATRSVIAASLNFWVRG